MHFCRNFCSSAGKGEHCRRALPPLVPPSPPLPLLTGGAAASPTPRCCFWIGQLMHTLFSSPLDVCDLHSAGRQAGAQRRLHLARGDHGRH